MARSTVPTDELLAAAATLRAQGISWAAIGRELKRNPDAIERWEELAPEKWGKYYRRAVRQLARDLIAESVTALRADLRVDDDKARRDAASKLLRYGLATRKAPKKPAAKPVEAGPSSAGVRFAKYVESLTPEQLSNLIRDLGYVRVTP